MPPDTRQALRSWPHNATRVQSCCGVRNQWSFSNRRASAILVILPRKAPYCATRLPPVTTASVPWPYSVLGGLPHMHSQGLHYLRAWRGWNLFRLDTSAVLFAFHVFVERAVCAITRVELVRSVRSKLKIHETNICIFCRCGRYVLKYIENTLKGLQRSYKVFKHLEIGLKRPQEVFKVLEIGLRRSWVVFKSLQKSHQILQGLLLIVGLDIYHILKGLENSRNVATSLKALQLFVLMSCHRTSVGDLLKKEVS